MNYLISYDAGEIKNISLIRRPPLGVCRVKPAVLLSCWCCTVVLLYCCTAVLCCIYTTVVVNRGQGLRTPTSAPFRPIPLNSTHPAEFQPILPHSKKHRYLRGQMATICPPLPCSCYRPAAGATLQGLCRKGYAARAIL